MPTPSSASIIAASNDQDLLARTVALGAALGLSQGQIEQARTKLATMPVDGTGEHTIASVYENAVANYSPPPRPGVDPSRVRDDQIVHALEQFKADLPQDPQQS